MKFALYIFCRVLVTLGIIVTIPIWLPVLLVLRAAGAFCEVVMDNYDVWESDYHAWMRRREEKKK